MPEQTPYMTIRELRMVGHHYAAHRRCRRPVLWCLVVALEIVKGRPLSVPVGHGPDCGEIPREPMVRVYLTTRDNLRAVSNLHG